MHLEILLIIDDEHAIVMADSQQKYFHRPIEERHVLTYYTHLYNCIDTNFPGV